MTNNIKTELELAGFSPEEIEILSEESEEISEEYTSVDATNDVENLVMYIKKIDNLLDSGDLSKYLADTDTNFNTDLASKLVMLAKEFVEIPDIAHAIEREFDSTADM